MRYLSLGVDTRAGNKPGMTIQVAFAFTDMDWHLAEVNVTAYGMSDEWRARIMHQATKLMASHKGENPRAVARGVQAILDAADMLMDHFLLPQERAVWVEVIMSLRACCAGELANWQPIEQPRA